MISSNHPTKRTWSQAIAWVLLVLSLIPPAWVLQMTLAGCTLDGLEVVLPIAGATYGVIGRILTHLRRNNRMSWVIAFTGASFLMTAFSQYAACNSEIPEAFPQIIPAKILENALSFWFVASSFVIIPATFPNGRLPEGKARHWIIGLLALALAANLISVVSPGPIGNEMIGYIHVENPIAVSSPVLRALKPFADTGLPYLLIAAIAVAIGVYIQNYRRATGVAHQQFKVLAIFLSTVVLFHVLVFELIVGTFFKAFLSHWSYDVILMLSFGGYPVVLGLIIFRYRLYDIDLIIRRTLSYTLLTGALVVIYFGGVVVTQWFFQLLTGNSDSPLVTVISTLAIAGLFNPLRVRTQEFIDRRFYRTKYDAEQALRTFAETARSEVDIDRLNDALMLVVKNTMKPERISLHLKQQDH